VKWTKQDDYHATFGKFTMSYYNNKSIFMLYKYNELLICGSRKECLNKFNKENKNEI